MRETIEKTKLHAAQYPHVDGSFEFTMGGSLLLMALAFAVVDRITSNSTFVKDWVLSYLPLAVFAGGAALLDAWIKHFRVRFTIPRSGYIEMKRPQPLSRSIRWLIWIGVPLLTVSLLSFLSLNRGRFPAAAPDVMKQTITFFFGIILSGIWVIAGWKLKLARFYLIAFISLAACGAVFLGFFDGNSALALLFGATGIALCLTGGFTLWQYLRGIKPQENTSAAMK